MKYSKELNFANEGFANAAGFDNYLYAEGAGAPIAATSSPYIVTLTNSATDDVTDVTFLGAVDGLLAGSTGNWGVTAGISVSYGYPNISYQKFLYSLQRKSALVSQTYIECSVTAQLEQTITITTMDVQGNSQSKSFVPTVNPNQYQTTRIVMDATYILNEFTTLKLARVKAGATVTFKIYPSAIESSISGITGQGANTYVQPALSGMKVINAPALPASSMYDRM